MPTLPKFPPRTLALLVVATAVAACSGHSDASADDSAGGAHVSMRSASAPVQALGEGDIRIVASDSGVDLALIGDSISTGLSQHALAKARAATDTATVKGSGFGASLERMVKEKVAGAIGTRMSFPLSAVRDARYENGAIHFDWAGKPVTIFDHSKVNNRPILESFQPDDARRFVDAVNARKKSPPAL